MPRLQASGAFAQALDDNARALNGAYWKVYAAGTTTQATTYSNALLTIASAWPVIGDAAGRIPDIYVAPGNYRIRVETAGGVLIAESDNNVVYGLDPGEVAVAKFKTVPILLADETMGYALGGAVSIVVTTGDRVQVGTFYYDVLASGSSTADVTTSGGVKLEYIPGDVVNVLALGVDSTGATDDTAIYNAASLKHKSLYFPNGTYRGAGVLLRNGMTVEGESKAGVILEVGTNDRGFFETEGATIVFDVRINNVSIKAASGVTGARGILQTDLTSYLAYPVFENIEFYLDLRRALEITPIFVMCRDVRDGYLGTQPGAQVHQFMSARYQGTPPNSPNLNHFVNCQFFRSDDPDGAIYIEFGWSFGFVHCDWEQCGTRAMRLASVAGVSISQSWVEACGSVASPEIFRLENSALPGAHPTSLMMRDMTVDFGPASPITRFINGTGASRWGIEGATFRNAPSGSSLGRTDQNAGLPLRGYVGALALSGAGAGAFFDGMYSTLDDVHIQPSVLPAPGMQSVDVLEIDDGLLAANFAAATDGANPPNLTDIASSVYPRTALRMTASDAFSWLYYQIPAKLVANLQGRTVTLIIGGHWDATGIEAARLAVWDSVSPTSGNMTTLGGAGSSDAIVGSDTAYKVRRLQFTVGAAASSLAVGIRTGGDQNDDKFALEKIELLDGITSREL